MTLKNITWKGSDVFKQLLSGEVGKSDENGTTPTKITSSVTTSVFTETQFKKKIGCSDEQKGKIYRTHATFKGQFSDQIANELFIKINEIQIKDEVEQQAEEREAVEKERKG